jgi:hypothetical protein
VLRPELLAVGLQGGDEPDLLQHTWAKIVREAADAVRELDRPPPQR